jgi:hypothetical protein
MNVDINQLLLEIGALHMQVALLQAELSKKNAPPETPTNNDAN